MVTSFHGNEFKRYWGWGGFVYSRLFQLCDAFVVNGGFAGRRLNDLGCPRTKIVEIPVAVNDSDIKPRAKGLKPTTCQILTVGRLGEEKGIHHAIRAIAHLRKRGYHVKYTVVGDGPWKKKLKNKAQVLGITDDVEFTGWLNQKEVFDAYRRSDIFILPSIETKKAAETQGLVIQEAQMHGLTVVASNTGGIPQSVNYGKAGLLCKPGDAEDLAVKLQMLLDYPLVTRGLAKAGVEYSKKRYSKAVTTSQMVALYNLLLGK